MTSSATPFTALDNMVLAHVGDNSRGKELAAHADGAVFHGSAGFAEAPFIESAAADPRLGALFGCDCSVCGKNGDVRELTRPKVKPQLQDEHSIAAAVKLAHQVLSAQDPVEQWVKTCQAALEAYDKLGRFDISGPAKPGALEAWITVLASAPASATSRTPSLR